MAGGLSSGAMIYMAGIWKQTIGFSAMVQVMMIVSLVFSAILFATAALGANASPLFVQALGKKDLQQ